MQLKSRIYFIATSQRWILCVFTFFLFVCGCSYQRCPRLVWEELKNSDRWKRFSSYLSLHSCEVHHLVLHSSPQDLLQTNRFKVSFPNWIHKIFLIQTDLKSSSPTIDSQDLLQPNSFKVFLPKNGFTRSCSMSIQTASLGGWEKLHKQLIPPPQTLILTNLKSRWRLSRIMK